MNGELSAEEACRAALERLESENPRIGAVVAWDGERALAEARERDGLPHVWRGPLHGVPFTAKDLNDATPYPTTYGSRAFAGHVPAADAACVARLRRAGAVLIGKTNTPEMGLRPTTENLLFGPTRNPHDTTRTPGGSSGGAAAALAAGIGTLAQGSDGGGSIRIPAACCGIVGHKPTRGLVSSAPASYGGWEGFATNGPMARTVAGCALMLEVMAGPEMGDVYAAPSHDGAFAAACAEDPAALAVGVIHKPLPASSTTRWARSSTRCSSCSRTWATASSPPRRRSQRSSSRSTRSSSGRRRRSGRRSYPSATTCSSRRRAQR
jgi:amidase